MEGHLQCLVSGYLCALENPAKIVDNGEANFTLARSLHLEITPFLNEDKTLLALQSFYSKSAFSWTAVVVRETSDAGDVLHVKGFLAGVNGEAGTGHLDVPNWLQIKEFTIARDTIIVLNTAGHLFRYHQNEWKKIMTDTDTKFVSLVGQEKNLLAIDEQGLIWSPPTCLFPTFGVKVKEVACGKEHFVAITETGDAYSWGTGSRGQLGHGTLLNEEQPRLIESLQGIQLKKVACGGWHTCVLSDGGDLYVWGWNESGQLGLPATSSHSDRDKAVNIQSEPLLLEAFGVDDSPVKSVACGSRHSAVVLADGSGWSWGWNGKGQLGLGDSVSRDRPTRVTGFYSPSSVPARQSMPLLSDVMASAWNTFWLTSTKV